jgi:hypothetical protein
MKPSVFAEGFFHSSPHLRHSIGSKAAAFQCEQWRDLAAPSKYSYRKFSDLL